MRKWIDLCESAPRTLYHGTLREYLPTIMKQGLEPAVGDFVSHFYEPDREDEYYDPEHDSLEPLVFAASKHDLQRCVNAIQHRLRAERMPSTSENVIRYGAIVVYRDEDEHFYHRPAGDEAYQADYPTQVEPGDFYSDRNIVPTYCLTGSKLRDLLRRNGVEGFVSPRPPIRPTP